MRFAPDLSRVRSLYSSLPAKLPDPATLVEHRAHETATVLWPLLAARNVKRLLLALRDISVADSELAPACGRLADEALRLGPQDVVRFVTQPELTSWLLQAESRGMPPLELTAHLGALLVAEVAQAGGSTATLPVAPTGRDVIHLRACGLTYRHHTDLPQRPSARVDAGVVVLDLPGSGVEVRPETPGVNPIAFVAGISVDTFPHRWAVQDQYDPVEGFWELGEDLTQQVGVVRNAVSLLQRLWPQAWSEIEVMLRWIVPFKVDDSFYIPGFRGMVAQGSPSVVRAARNILHESSHNKLSTILELTSVARNPLELIYSPFVKRPGPATSLIHSCWSFVRELDLMHRLYRDGLVADERRFVSEERKFYKFFELAFPVIHRDIRLTPFGAGLVSGMEAQLGELKRIGAPR